jgi:hypothetical protein
MRVLQAAQQAGRVAFDEVALYGAQIHAVVPTAQEYQEVVRRLLADENIPVTAVQWIAPTLEDVFISCVKQA